VTVLELNHESFGRIFAGAAGWLSLSLIVAGFVERVVMAL
jgi:hypothetical protein